MNLADIYMWALTGVALIGTWLNVKQQRVGFLFWMASNVGFCISNTLIGVYPLAFLFFVYFILAVMGWFSWKREEELQKAAATIEIAD